MIIIPKIIQDKWIFVINLAQEMQNKINFYIKHCFETMDTDKCGKVTFEKYLSAISKDIYLLEVFECLNENINEI